MLEKSNVVKVSDISFPIRKDVIEQPYKGAPLNKEKALDMLANLDPSMNYEDWLKVGMALKSGGLDVDIWDEWSKKSNKYQEGLCQSKWGSFSNVDFGITIGTLIHMAKESGWRDNQDDTVNPQFISPTIFQGQPIPEQEWIVDQWIPVHSAASLYGDGGTGKSLLALQLLTSVALGKDWLGEKVTQCKSIGFFCEDTKEELQRRQDKINREYGCEFSDLSNMLLYSGVGENNILMGFDREEGKLTALYESIKQKAVEFDAKFIVIDTAADTFAGNENSRVQVRQFISSLNKLAYEIDGAVLLCAHPSLSGMNSGEGTGGNTAWNNSVRSRLYLFRPKDDEYALDSNVRFLSRKKSNYASINENIMCRWKDGVFVHVDLGSGDKQSEENLLKAETLILDCIDSCKKTNQNLSDSKNSTNYLPKKVLLHSREFSIGVLELAMTRLFMNNKITNEEYGRPSNPSKKVVRVKRDGML